jgi:hypothetical protein
MALSQSQGPLPRPSVPLLGQQQNHQRIRSAGSTGESDQTTQGRTAERSPSRSGSTPRLDTVDLSHKRIADVPIEVVEELKNEVEKLALGYNLLKDLPSYFVGFGSRLKYLNVRVNLLTTFPAVVSTPFFWFSIDAVADYSSSYSFAKCPRSKFSTSVGTRSGNCLRIRGLSSISR